MWLMLLVSVIVSNIYGGWWWVATYLCIVLVGIQRRPPPILSRALNKEEIQIMTLIREHFGPTATYLAGQDGVLVGYDAPAPEHGSDSSSAQRIRQVLSWSWFLRAGVDLPFACTMDERTGEKVFLDQRQATVLSRPAKRIVHGKFQFLPGLVYTTLAIGGITT